MADIAGALFDRYEQETSQLRTLQRANTDNITKLLTSGVASPSTMLGIAQTVTQPQTLYEVARGRPRPSANEVARAAMASDLKHATDVSSVINQGIDNSAHEMQLVINALNARTAMGNSNTTPVRNVMNTMTPLMEPADALLFNREFLGMLSEGGDNISDQAAWAAAASAWDKVQPKAKIKDNKVMNSNGDLISINPRTNVAEQLWKGTPKSGSEKGLQSKIIYTERTVTNEDGSQTTFKEPVGEYIPNRGAPGYVNPGIKVANPNGGPSINLTGTKTTPSAELKESPAESTDTALVSTGLDAAKQLRDKLMPNGKVDFIAVRKMASGIGGGDLQALMQQAGTGIRHSMYGASLTDAERANFSKGFEPGFMDVREDTVKQKVDGLIKYLENDLTARKGARKPGGNNKGKSIPETGLAKIKDALSKGAPKDAIIKDLQSKGYDTSGL